MILTQEMISKAFKLMNEFYGYGFSQNVLFINYNPYIASWFSSAIKQLYDIEMPHIPTKKELQNWKQQTERKEKLIKLKQ